MKESKNKYATKGNEMLNVIHNNKYMKILHGSFQVDTNYIIWKFKTLLFPYITYTFYPNYSETPASTKMYLNLNECIIKSNKPSLSYIELLLPTITLLYYITLATFTRRIHEHGIQFTNNVAFVLLIKNVSLVVLEALLLKTVLPFTTSLLTFVPKSMNKYTLMSVVIVVSLLSRNNVYIVVPCIMYSLITITYTMYLSLQHVSYVRSYNDSMVRKVMVGVIEVVAIIMVLIDI
jgi:hypothetical protein